MVLPSALTLSDNTGALARCVERGLPLEQSKSKDLFGNNNNQKEWNYPRTFLASDGNIVGISYNKIWVMDLKNNFRLTKTGEIPLVKSGISRIEKFQKPNLKSSEIENLKLKFLP